MSVANRNGRLMQKEQHVDYGKEMGSEKELDGLKHSIKNRAVQLLRGNSFLGNSF